MIRLSVCLVLALVLATAAMTVPADGGSTPLTTKRVASGLNRPVFVGSPPGDYERLFIVEQRGVIRILNLLTGVVNTTPFLNIDALVSGPVNSFDERGLLGLAFDPDYANNGFFYVNYTNNGNATTIARYQVSASDPDIANPQGTIILTIAQPFENHNGGWIGFSPLDGYLYIATGDGGAGCDVGQRAQDITGQLLGKMLRIDVSSLPYTNPPDNPFVGTTGDDEIWLYGLRNPFRCSFDRATGDLYMGDVGQDAFEEISFHMGGAPGGLNYGWDCKEGFQCATVSCAPPFGCDCSDPTLTNPIQAYGHGGGNCSVTGGYVYRGMAMPDMQGIYFYADWCSNQIWSFVYDGVSVGQFMVRTTELAPGGGLFIQSIASFGEDAAGEIYICDRTGTTAGEVFKIVPANIDELDCNGNFIVDSVEISLGLAEDCNNNGAPDDCDIADGTSTDADGNGVPDECELPPFVRGDCNDDGDFNVADPVFLLDNLFGPGPDPTCGDACDANDDGGLDVADPVYMLSALFDGGPQPAPPHPGCGIDVTNTDALDCAVFTTCP